MQSFCVREGQVEVGVIEHQGRTFAAMGATVSGRAITGYTRLDGNYISLTTWCGKTLIAGRCAVVERYWSGSLALVFRLSKGKFIVGYALGDEGMLFRGELLTDSDELEACRMSRMLSDCFAELDADDEFEQDD